MPETRSIDDLRPALRAWYDEVAKAISANLNAYVVTNVDERWQRGSDGTYLRLAEREQAWMPERGELEGLPTYAALRVAAERSMLLGPMMSQDAGTAVGLSPFNFERFALAVLPSPNEFAGGQLPTFEARFDHLSALLTADQAEYLVTYGLLNVSFDLDHVELAPDLAIERLTPREIEAALDADILRPLRGSIPAYRPTEGAAFGLKKTWRLPRIIGGGISQGQRDEIAELIDPRELGTDLLQCLALMSGCPIYITGTMTRRLDDDFTTFSPARMSRSLPTPYVPDGEGFRLDKAKCAELQHIWQASHKQSFPRNKALVLAIRRLGFATQRERIEDRIIDVLIAAEAFYLTDAGDVKERGELRYRLALRAAVWSEGTLANWTRREVFAHMKRAYDLRSAVAHGSGPKPKDITVKDGQVSLPEFVDATEEVVRAGLHKALNQASSTRSRLAIAWEDLLLPEEQPAEPDAGNS